MRANRIRLIFLAATLLACGSGDAGSGGSPEASPGLEGSADVTEAGLNDAAASGDGGAEAGPADGASSDAGDGAAPCTGVPQSRKGSCLWAQDAGPPLLCIEFTGTLTDYNADDCTLLSPDALYSTTQGCPTAALLGRCLQQCGAPDETVGYDYVASAAGYQQSCESGGGIFLP
jgi:hypothetical protein